MLPLCFLFIVCDVIAFGVLLFIFPAVQIVSCIRAGTMTCYLLILHVVLTSASFHNALFGENSKKTIPYLEASNNLLGGFLANR